ncbi:MAG: hypothetical protein ABJN35_07815 [Erythrobacter sp.]
MGHRIIIQHFAHLFRCALRAQELPRFLTQEFLVVRKIKIHLAATLYCSRGRSLGDAQRKRLALTYLGVTEARLPVFDLHIVERFDAQDVSLVSASRIFGTTTTQRHAMKCATKIHDQEIGVPLTINSVRRHEKQAVTSRNDD